MDVWVNTVAEAQKRFEAHCKGESTIPADLRSAVYSTVLKHGDGSTLESVMQLLKEADLHEEKVRLMRCMGAVSQPDLIKKVCDFSLSVRFIKLCINYFFTVKAVGKPYMVSDYILESFKP